MPRGKNGRGGSRLGTPGEQYPNRRDLRTNQQPIQAATNQPYGQAGAQQAAQRALPLPQQPGPPQPQGPGPGQFMPPPPGSLPPLTAPTERPNEPLTAGLSTGAGPGPEVLAQGGMSPQLSPVDQIRALYLQFPDESLRRLIDYASQDAHRGAP